MKLEIDLNADLGEGAASETELLALVSSASIACGFHAGDSSSMTASILAAREAGVAVGAHPGLADRQNFGRVEQPLTPNEAFALVTYQVGTFQALAISLDVRPNHVKPHGALYNMAARDFGLAEAVAQAVLAVDPSLILLAPPASALARAGGAIGLRIAREVFADRNYLPNGALVPRSQPDALVCDPEEAAGRVVRMLREEVVRAIDGSDIAIAAETICLHGDKPEAVVFAKLVRARLAEAGVAITALSA